MSDQWLHHRRRIGALLAFLLLSLVANSCARADTLMVFAAASLTNALTDIGHAYQQQYATKVTLSFASSSTLARQISLGAPADVYLSANTTWMDWLEKKQQIKPDSRTNLVGNKLVLIAASTSTIEPLDLGSSTALLPLLGDKRLAVGNPDHVPAGRYAKQALSSLHQWEALKTHLAAAANVRVALAQVALNETPLGIVYATDAAASSKVRVVGVFPAASHAPIIYPAAITRRAANPKAAARFMIFLQGADATEIFRRYGFSVHNNLPSTTAP